MAQKIFNLIILDASGSMHSIRKQAIDGVNETLQTIKADQNKHPEQQHFVSFVSFNSDMYNVVYDRVLANKTTELQEKDYVPNCATPLYDSIGRAVTNLRDYVTEEDAVLVTIITDGYENSSREFNGKAIASLIEEMKKKDWIFTYIGANQDVEKVAKSMNIDNHMAFESDEVGTLQMFVAENESRAAFYDRVRDYKSGNMSKEAFRESGFFKKRKK